MIMDGAFFTGPLMLIGYPVEIFVSLLFYQQMTFHPFVISIWTDNLF